MYTHYSASARPPASNLPFLQRRVVFPGYRTSMADSEHP